ncbi:Prolyl oligopeptidase family protein [Marininema mesophilum]|uniref:Prolyl oligopeptidase family protein n=1 Tax=Marininema mesophilum TaxID=1048340 RepID=A0A1H3CCJ5_9BACL|nr:prolyl oligopeptidase family serine peptidase [Marininema mesophilum]SDX51209.1 Prolyl oligopeptidase family protein [Marininema mesophilum]
MKRLGVGALLFLLLAGISFWVTWSEIEGKDSPVQVYKRQGDPNKSQGSFEATNGKIVSKERIRPVTGYEDKTTLYRITYMSDGVRVVGYLCKPKRIEAKKLPVLIFNRGGIAYSSHINKNTLRYLSKLASNQYVVLASEYRGVAGGEGKPELAGKDVRDVLNLIPLAEKLPYADSKRKVMLGFSRGGMMTYMAAKSGADVDAIAVVGGVTDLSQIYERSGDIFRNPLSRLVGDPLLDPKAYQIRSALNWPDKLKVPVLILHGLKDPVVPVEQSQQLVAKLKKLGYENRLVLVPGGNHYLTNKTSIRDREILQWFQRYINN